MQKSNITFCDNSQLSYDKFNTQFIDGQGLVFDDAYRLAHLPLVAPGHPRIISTKPGTSYNNGVHDLVYSIAMPIAANELFSSAVFNELHEAIKDTNFAHKLSWDTFAERKNKLHATIYGSISTGQAPNIEPQIYQDLRAIGPVSVSIRGMFSGNRNIGRLYLKVYPELRNGKNMCHVIQKAFGSPPTELYVVGLFNFVEELSPSETADLSKFLNLWRDKEIMQSRLESLWLLKSRDDLVLDGAIDRVIPLI